MILVQLKAVIKKTNTSLHMSRGNVSINHEEKAFHIANVNNEKFRNPTTGRKITGRVIFQQVMHLSSMLFLARATTLCLTGLPQPNPKCVEVQNDAVTYVQALVFVYRKGFLPHGCGDLIFSGHVGCILICVYVLTRNRILVSPLIKCVTWVWSLIGILSTISCRSHYSVDAVLAFYFAFGIQDFYYARSHGFVDGGAFGRWIRFLED